ncbi:MAG: hypothetical protein GXX96_26375 [Planctomycetaceae bacterium]|nr:hypothetical protein [Planctomycetaceae bacterium]
MKDRQVRPARHCLRFIIYAAPAIVFYGMTALTVALSVPSTTAGAGNEATPEQYVVPNGNVTELVAFIQRVSTYHPTTVEEDIRHRTESRPALKLAAERILTLEEDKTSMDYEAARFVLLIDRIRSLACLARQDQETTLADVRSYVAQRIEMGQDNVALQVAKLTGMTCRATGQYDLAADAYAAFGKLFEGSTEQNVAEAGRIMYSTSQQLLAASKNVPQVPAVPDFSKAGRLVPLDLQACSNLNVRDTADSGRFAGNGLAELPVGKHVLGGVPFEIGKQAIQTKTGEEPNVKSKVEGIPVNLKVARLFLLHATGSGSPYFTDGTQIGRYVIRFDNGSQELIPIVYGEDVRDWWDFDEGKPVTRGRVVWIGRNRAADTYDVGIRLYLGVWVNPHPEVQVTAIDYIATDETCNPFCVAMTVEEPARE